MKKKEDNTMTDYTKQNTDPIETIKARLKVLNDNITLYGWSEEEEKEILSLERKLKRLRRA